MNFKYLQKTTLIDYPGEIASTLFVGGCNFNCAFCYNKALVHVPDSFITISESQILKILLSRQKYINHVVITGGEPTLQGDLIPFLEKLKQHQFKVKLDTNGYRPQVLESVMARNLVDYIAMDIKSPLEQYDKICGLSVDSNQIFKSIQLLKSGQIDFEFRTTLWKNAFNLDEISMLFELVGSSKIYYLQNFYEVDGTSDYEPMSQSDIQPILELSREKGVRVVLRGDW